MKSQRQAKIIEIITNRNVETQEQLLHELDKQHKGLRYRIFGAMQRGEIDGFKIASSMDGIKDYDGENNDD